MAAGRDLYGLLDQIRERPSMFIVEHSLTELSAMLHGYQVCLWSHGIEEDAEGRPFRSTEFEEWLQETRGWSTSCGFSHAIEHQADGPEAGLALFFELVAEYRQS